MRRLKQHRDKFNNSSFMLDAQEINLSELNGKEAVIHFPDGTYETHTLTIKQESYSGGYGRGSYKEEVITITLNHCGLPIELELFGRGEHGLSVFVEEVIK